MVSDEDKLKIDLYWKMYNEHATQARHHDILRGTISTILVSVGAGIFSLYNLNHGALGKEHNIYIGLLMIAVGALGGLLSYKHYERNQLHVSILRQFRGEIDNLPPSGGSINAINAKGREDHRVEYPFTSEWLRVHQLWLAIFGIISGAGALIICN
jgi:hypothetical protein